LVIFNESQIVVVLFLVYSLIDTPDVRNGFEKAI